MTKREIVGRRVWVTRDSVSESYEFWLTEPHWDEGMMAGYWRGRSMPADGLLDSPSVEEIKRWYGVDPKLPGGRDSIRRATLYCKLELEDE